MVTFQGGNLSQENMKEKKTEKGTHEEEKRLLRIGKKKGGTRKGSGTPATPPDTRHTGRAERAPVPLTGGCRRKACGELQGHAALTQSLSWWARGVGAASHITLPPPANVVAPSF